MLRNDELEEIKREHPDGLKRPRQEVVGFAARWPRLKPPVPSWLQGKTGRSGNRDVQVRRGAKFPPIKNGWKKRSAR